MHEAGSGGIPQRFEAWLYRRGFEHDAIRALVRNQLALAVVSIVALSLGSGLANWALSYSAGCILVTGNFWGMAKLAQRLVMAQKGGTAALLLFFYFRLALTGLALYVLIAWLDANIPGLLAGLATVVVTAIIWGVRAALDKS